MPQVASRLLQQDGCSVSFKELEDIIEVDVGLTDKILRIANSALYARQREITSLQTVMTLLGFKNIKTLVLLATASTLFQKTK